jgi:hypothetical protein
VHEDVPEVNEVERCALELVLHDVVPAHFESLRAQRIEERRIDVGGNHGPALREPSSNGARPRPDLETTPSGTNGDALETGDRARILDPR